MKCSRDWFESGIWQIRAVFWDLDGTLLNSAATHLKGWCAAVLAFITADLRVELPPDFALRQRGKSNEDAAKMALRALYERYGAEFIKLKREYVVRHAAEATIYRSVGPALENLRMHGYLQGMLTSSPRDYVNLVFGGHPELYVLKPATITVDELPRDARGAPRGKPDPVGLQMLCELLKVQPREAIYVGDSLQSDGKAAENAGCHFILACPDGSSLDPIAIPPSVPVVHSYDELLAILPHREGRPS